MKHILSKTFRSQSRFLYVKQRVSLEHRYASKKLFKSTKYNRECSLSIVIYYLTPNDNSSKSYVQIILQRKNENYCLYIPINGSIL